MLLFEYLIWNAVLDHTYAVLDCVYAVLEHIYAVLGHAYAVLEQGGVINQNMLLFKFFCFLGGVINQDVLLNKACFCSQLYGTYKMYKT